MMEEEHRHEERLHRKKERALDREKKQEDKRRKQWEEYEKCLEREAEESVDLFCEEPEFHRAPRGHRRHRRHASVEPVTIEPLEIEDEDDTPWSEDYDFNAPFNGGRTTLMHEQ